MTEKPLNVRVAIATGWRDLREENGTWWGYPPEWFDSVGGCLFEVPPWGEDSQNGWKWTGPLMAKYGISLVDLTHGESALWAACDGLPICGAPATKESDEGLLLIDGYVDLYRLARNPVAATAELILALAEAGRLPR